jgi:hypothetical protein
LDGNEELMSNFPKSLALLSLRSLDALLPKHTRTWHTGDRFRARSTALMLSVALLSSSLHLLQLHREGVKGMHLVTGYVFLSIIGSSLLVLRWVARPQVFGTAYLVFIFLVTVLLMSVYGRSNISASLFWYPATILGVFLVTRPRPACWVAGGMITTLLLHVLYLRQFGLRQPFDLTFEAQIARMTSSLVLNCFVMLLMVIAFLALARTNRRAWQNEKDWQLQTVRMQEISELAASAAFLLEKPLQNLQAQHAALLKETADPQEDLDILDSMGQDLQAVTRISESFSLLAHPKQTEKPERMEAAIWLEHLTHIVLRRVTEKFWDLQMSSEAEDLMIVGPMGRLSMLVVLCLQPTFVSPAPEPGSPVRIRVRGHDGRLQIIIEYAAPYDLMPLDDEVTQSLRDELLSSLSATLDATRKQGIVHLVIEGPWLDVPESSA